jgi:hypothetical protein
LLKLLRRLRLEGVVLRLLPSRLTYICLSGKVALGRGTNRCDGCVGRDVGYASSVLLMLGVDRLVVGLIWRGREVGRAWSIIVIHGLGGMGGNGRMGKVEDGVERRSRMSRDGCAGRSNTDRLDVSGKGRADGDSRRVAGTGWPIN